MLNNIYFSKNSMLYQTYLSITFVCATISPFSLSDTEYTPCGMPLVFICSLALSAGWSFIRPNIAFQSSREYSLFSFNSAFYDMGGVILNINYCRFD